VHRTATEPRRLANLDGLRGLAAVAVVSLHGSEIFGGPWKPFNAYLAVDFFFLLSGYVLARTFDVRLRAGWAWAFMARRLIRLYPLIVAGSAVGFLVLALRSIIAHALPLQQVALNTLCSLLLLPTPPVFSATWSIYPNDPPLWSLFYELLANFAYAMLAPWLSNRRLAVLIALSAVPLVAAIVTFDSADFALDHFQLGGLRVLFSFFLGVAFFRAEALAPHRKVRIHGPLTRNLVTALTFLVLGGVLFSPAPLSATYALVSIFLLFPALLLLALEFQAAVLQRTFVFLGAVSYPIYALHQPFFRLVSGAFVHTAALPWRLTALAISFGAILLLAWLSTIFYDTPVRGWLSARLLGAPQRRPGGILDVGAAGSSGASTLSPTVLASTRDHRV
jgi:peptidoglycan/LPS O-acetylase OafA/YrhL